MKSNLIKLLLLFSFTGLLLTGCALTPMTAEQLGMTWNEYVDYQRSGKKPEEFKAMQKEAKEEERKRLEHFASYEKNYLKEYNDILKNPPKYKTTYIQPANKKEPCKKFFEYTGDDKWFKEESYKIFWDGECKNGYADGLGRAIEKDTLIDKWGLAIYKNGKPTYYIVNDVLKNDIFEGIDDKNMQNYFGVLTQITEKMGDIDLVNIAVAYNKNDQITLFSSTSPFWNESYTLTKSYPNFEYVYDNQQNNDEAEIDFAFFLSDKKNKNGWTIGKPKGQNVISGEFVMDNFNKAALPSSYNTKADKIIKEIYEAQQKAYQAQEQAQLVKKQYMKKICKDSVKVGFMDNDDYKLICNNYQREKELFTKINDKLERLTKEKIARLEQQRYTAQQQMEEQYRQQQLAIERQKLAAQQAQAIAAQNTANAASRANFQNSLNNLNQQLQNNRLKSYNVTPTFGGGYNIREY